MKAELIGVSPMWIARKTASYLLVWVAQVNSDRYTKNNKVFYSKINAKILYTKIEQCNLKTTISPETVSTCCYLNCFEDIETNRTIEEQKYMINTSHCQVMCVYKCFE